MTTKALLILGLFALTSCKSHVVTVNDVPNFKQVKPGLCRGGQPTTVGWNWLNSNGYTNVVKLNLEEEGSDLDAMQLKMDVYYAPILLREQLLGPIPQLVVETAVQGMVRPGTFVHCEHGQDRTGLICAVYRVKHDGWTKAQAEKEMLANGFHKELHGLWDWWEDWKP